MPEWWEALLVGLIGLNTAVNLYRWRADVVRRKNQCRCGK